MGRTYHPLWPTWAWRVRPGCPGARPGASRERFGSVRDRSGSVKTALLAMEKWTQAKNMDCLSNLSSTNEHISENDTLANALGQMGRTYQPLWPTWAWRVRPGRPGARPGASRERFGSVRERSGSAKTPLHAMDKWTRAKPVSYTHLTLPTICSV